MASNPSFVTYAIDQMGPGASAKKMFGEYGVYKDGVLFALICDDTVFLKNNEPAREHLGEVKEGLPYPGAKPWIIIDPEDADLLREVISITLKALPPPKPKVAKKKTVKKKPAASKAPAKKKAPRSKR